MNNRDVRQCKVLRFPTPVADQNHTDQEGVRFERNLSVIKSFLEMPSGLIPETRLTLIQCHYKIAVDERGEPFKKEEAAEKAVFIICKELLSKLGGKSDDSLANIAESLITLATSKGGVCGY